MKYFEPQDCLRPVRSEERRRRLMVRLNFLLRRAKPGGEHSVLAAGSQLMWWSWALCEHWGQHCSHTAGQHRQCHHHRETRQLRNWGTSTESGEIKKPGQVTGQRVVYHSYWVLRVFSLGFLVFLVKLFTVQIFGYFDNQGDDVTFTKYIHRISEKR